MSAASDRMHDIGAAARGAASDARNIAGEARDAARTIAGEAKDSAKAELAALREKVEALMAERVNPALNDAKDAAEGLAQSAAETVRERTGQLASTVRDQPLIAVGAAALAGIAIGLLIRR